MAARMTGVTWMAVMAWMTRGRAGVAALLVLVALLAACMEGGPQGQRSVQVTQAWSRAIPPNAPVAAGFMTLRNAGRDDDRLVAVRSASAARVEIHEIRHEHGVARMRELAGGLPLPAGATVELAPGGYHLMFIDPGEGFVAGARVAATLVFERAGEREVVFEVRAIGATRGAQAGDGEHHQGH